MSSTISPQFLQHAKQHFLAPEQEQDFISACQRPLRKSIRMNKLKISRQQFLLIMKRYDIELQTIPWCRDGFWLSCGRPSNENVDSNYLTDLDRIGLWPEHLQGLFYIQEASSMLPPMALLAQNYEQDWQGNAPKLLDMAAAPGSKTTQMAAMLKNQGLILANELSASRLKGLQANLVSCGVVNCCLSQFDGRKLGERLDGLFDYVLLDAPCGGEGTVRKDPNALKNWNSAQLIALSRLQKELIASAYRCLKPGGRLVYSTCSLSPEENQQVVSELVRHSDAQIVSLDQLFEGAEKSLTDEGFLHVLPHIYDSEGFFIAAIEKPQDSVTKFYPASIKRHFVSLDKKLKIELSKFLQSHFGFDLSCIATQLRQRDKEIWLFPAAFESINQVMRLNRSGIKIADCYPNKFRLTHEFVSCFFAQFKRQKLALSLMQTKSFYQGKDLLLDHSSRLSLELQLGELILTYNEHFIGLGGLQKLKIKNRLPRDRVVDKLNWDMSVFSN